MSENRKDHKGRLLQTGESQRKDGFYQFHYTDVIELLERYNHAAQSMQRILQFRQPEAQRLSG